ncbi:MAG: SRPBCC domain-containing protein [Planctomycetota bacterium]|nr:SRPBCC domain-containing protein [Planctomycetota bacterium]
MHQSHAPDVVVERHIRATPQRIWRALTDARELERWFFTECTTDPRPAGSYHAVWKHRSDHSKTNTRFGKYLEFQPHTRLSFEWQGSTTDPNKCLPEGLLTTVTITLTPRDGGTDLRLVHTGWPTDPLCIESRNGHEGGWTFYMNNLADVIQSGIDRRAESLEQATRAAPQPV